MSSENLTLVKSLYDAFGRGDVEAVLGMMAADLRWIAAEHSPYDRGTPYVGPQEVMQHIFARVATEWDGFAVVPTRFLDAGDTIIMEGRYAGVYKSTGRRTNAQVVHLWVVRDGKAVEFRQYADTAEFLHLTGKAEVASASA